MSKPIPMSSKTRVPIEYVNPSSTRCGECIYGFDRSNVEVNSLFSVSFSPYKNLIHILFLKVYLNNIEL